MRTVTYTGPRLDTPDHKELWRMLDRMKPTARIWFLSRCCEVASRRGMNVRVTEHTGTTAEAYQDLLALDNTYGLPLAESRAMLDSHLRRA